MSENILFEKNSSNTYNEEKTGDLFSETETEADVLTTVMVLSETENEADAEKATIKSKFLQTARKGRDLLN